ncbi:MAG: hypothetical protein FRX48_05887 [Lasallia pustulata]|uniref:Uncharacterized protein n=1 Tax=Lasallia pustulata TaxID=136370 RepID=A0A5M8PLV8_9LECA|nr:MAG: hypothetical protein FRX48_05887 [Lasallia pustulata]
MKSLIYSAIALISVASTLAAPTAEPVTDLEKRTSVWQPGKKQPWKFQCYCPSHPVVHKKNLCTKPGPLVDVDLILGVNVGLAAEVDLLLSLDVGVNANVYAFDVLDIAAQVEANVNLELAGPTSGLLDICVVAKANIPSTWIKVDIDAYVVTPLFQIFALVDLTLSFFQQQHFWQPPKGYQWICYPDGNGGYNVGAWDGKSSAPKGYFIIQILLEAQIQLWVGLSVSLVAIINALGANILALLDL